MLVVATLPMEPLRKLTSTIFYISADVADVWSDITDYILEQGGWSVINVKPNKACIKAECLGGAWIHGFVVKIRVFQIDTGLLAVEWKRKSGCAIKGCDGWLRFRSRFCQPVD